jgi:hypothetical protein
MLNTPARLAPGGAVVAMLFALLIATAAPASATVRKHAAGRAVAALGSARGSVPVIVFGLKKPLRPGTRVTQASRGKSAAFVARVGSERAFFFYEDSAPFQPYKHAGRVALVGARTGRVRLSKTIQWAPLIDGKLPTFLADPKRYASSEFQVFFRASTAASAAPALPASSPLTVVDPFTSNALLGSNPVHPNSPPKADKQEVTAKQNRSKSITLTGSDGDNDFLTYTITKPPDHGTLSGTPPQMIYRSDSNFLGKDDFSFKTSDGAAQSNTAKVTVHVVPVGQPPSVATSAGCTAYNQEDPAVVVDGLVTAADPDDTFLDSATVRIAANFVPGDDLLFTDQNGISGSYDDTIGVLTLTGTASVASYQAALRSVSYRNLAGSSPPPTKDIAFTVYDGGTDSPLATKQICIANLGPNVKPIGFTSEGAVQYVENDGRVPVDAGFIVFDANSAQLSGATVQFTPSHTPDADEVFVPPPPGSTNSFVPSEDSLHFTDQNGITGSYDSVNGVLTLTGAATVANYQTALRSVTYENSSENPSETLRNIRFQVTDSGGLNSTSNSRSILVQRVNDAPTVTPSAGSTGFTEGDPFTAVDPSLAVGDVDSTTITGGKVRIASGFESTDALLYVDQLGITGSYNSGTGVLTLTGAASVADYQTALRSIEFQNTSENPGPSRTVEYTVNDGELDSVAATKGIAVTAVNDRPILTTSAGTVGFTEGDAPVAVDTGVNASDVDSANFAGATVQVTGGFASGEDVLAFTDQNGISGNYNSTTGTLTLSGSAPIADYVTALRSVTYESSSDNPSAATRTVSFQVDDGGASNNLSDPATRDISVTPVNDAPVVTTSSGSTGYTAGDSSGVAVDGALTVSDADDANIESAKVQITTGFETADDKLVWADQNGITGSYDAGTGVLTLSGSASVADYQTALRSVLYRSSSASPAASKSVDFTVNDGDTDSAAASKAIDVTIPPPE